ncbi:MAG: N-methyl-L-tryptophan oxidase [Planctomycetota bacterium]|nr:N-methyl-L-tryptophan oxidase [Planctomycetota bacterium]
MPQRFDVIVVGLGTMGSATCHQLAKRGLRVLGIEQFGIPHAQGAHHGYSRLIRKAYFEHPNYVALLQRAYALYDELEAVSGMKLLYRTGGLYMGTPEGEAVGGTLRSAREHSLPVERLDHAALKRRFPQFHLPADHEGVLEQDAGFLVPERVVATQCDQALRHGAEIHGMEAVKGWEADGAGVRVHTAEGEYHARNLVLTSGAWTDRLVRDLGVPLVVTRQVWGWVWPRKPELFALGRLPVWALDAPGVEGGVHYGLPMMTENPGFKVALHRAMTPTDPDRVARDPQPGDLETFRPMLREIVPDGDGPLLALRVCLYTNSPDKHFILDTHPAHPNVALACGFSGHGFKFSAVVGEIMADLAQHGKARLPIEFLGLKRFKK